MSGIVRVRPGQKQCKSSIARQPQEAAKRIRALAEFPIMLAVKRVFFPEKGDLEQKGKTPEKWELQSEGDDITGMRERDDDVSASNSLHLGKCLRHVLKPYVLEYLCRKNRVKCPVGKG